MACFQIVMDSIITEEQVQTTFPYLENITICGIDQREHDVNRKPLLEQLLDGRLSMLTVIVCYQLGNWRFLVPSLKKGI